MAKDLDKLQTERLNLRGINETDAFEIVEWRSDPGVYKYFKNPHKITITEHFNWYNNSYLYNENRLDWMCIERATGKKIGIFGASRNKNCVEVSYLLAPESQHKGYASEVIKEIIQYIREKWKSKRIIAEIHRDNGPSIALVDRLGFKLEETDGEFVIYGIEG